MNIQIRHYDAVGDEAFLYSTWIKGYRDSGAVRAVPTPVYNIGQRNRIVKIMKDINTSVLVAADDETPELIYGYAVITNGNILQYIYVKNKYRRNGIAKALLASLNWNEPIFYTHKPSEIWCESKIKSDTNLLNLVYNPYLLENP